jgi:hypothetical protein
MHHVFNYSDREKELIRENAWLKTINGDLTNGRKKRRELVTVKRQESAKTVVRNELILKRIKNIKVDGHPFLRLSFKVISVFAYV